MESGKKNEHDELSNIYLLKSDFWKILAIGAVQTIALLGSIIYGAGILSNTLTDVESQVLRVETRLDNINFPFNEKRADQFEELRIRVDRLEKLREEDLRAGRLMSYKEKQQFVDELLRRYKISVPKH